jgi:hypothetical protein
MKIVRVRGRRPFGFLGREFELVPIDVRDPDLDLEDVPGSRPDPAPPRTVAADTTTPVPIQTTGA